MFSTALQVKLMQNPDFRDKFIRRYAKYLNTTFKTDRMLKILDESVAIIRDEMPRQIARWGVPGSMGAWNSERRVTAPDHLGEESAGDRHPAEGLRTQPEPR